MQSVPWSHRPSPQEGQDRTVSLHQTEETAERVRSPGESAGTKEHSQQEVTGLKVQINNLKKALVIVEVVLLEGLAEGLIDGLVGGLVGWGNEYNSSRCSLCLSPVPHVVQSQLVQQG